MKDKNKTERGKVISKHYLQAGEVLVFAYLTSKLRISRSRGGTLANTVTEPHGGPMAAASSNDNVEDDDDDDGTELNDETGHCIDLRNVKTTLQI